MSIVLIVWALCNASGLVLHVLPAQPCIHILFVLCSFVFCSCRKR